MNDCTRRAFLRQVLAGLGLATGGWLLSACGREEMPLPAATSAPTLAPASPTQESPTVAPPSPTTTAEAPTPAPPTTTPSVQPALAPPHLVVARNGDPEEMVRQAVSALGGMEKFVKPGDNVIIKPNICVAYHTYEYAATTNPWVVAALVKLVVEAGARRVRVMDYPFGGSAEQAYSTSGIQEQVRSAGGRMEAMAQFKFVDTSIPEGKDLRQCKIYDDVLNADVLIDVPVAKHHGLARLTLAMKNLMGVIYDRPAMHRNLGQRLADLTSRVRPTLTVVDAVRMLMDHGPTGGSLDDVKQANTVIASPDIVAADSYAATLFGLKPDDLAYIRAGTEMGLGRSDLDNLKIEEINVGG
ncbi:MAG: DUF362 domain-containing protein [Anaerolineae bacterium]